MKFTKILSLSFVSAIAVLGLNGVTASAAAVVGKTDSTPATVTIKDPDKPVDPTDPDQTRLTLDNVPTAYDFETSVRNKAYTISANALTNQSVDVFNDYTPQAWSVKATVLNGVIKDDTDAENPYDVTSFTINGEELVGTSSKGIVAKNNATPTAANNTGELSTAITSATISFTDTNNILKVGNKLTGTISYQLYNTIDAS